MCYTSRMKDFAFVSPQEYPRDLLARGGIRDFGPRQFAEFKNEVEMLFVEEQLKYWKLIEQNTEENKLVLQLRVHRINPTS